MISDLSIFGDWLIDTFVSLWKEIGTWGVIGGFIICAGIFSKVAVLLKKLWKGGV
ncbi:MAG: hypothetical protein NC123_04385 [Butyrivibrio sp.]|nr:hypothetical protein [Acetatifactor muris]MCM1558766.1 hypothetical protein [Butyrivibrio sp.]